MPSRTSESTPPRTDTGVLLVVMGLVVAYFMLTYNGFGLLWGDHARWLHEIDRGAGGERLYRDFYWPFPPLANWLVGGLARFVGRDFPHIVGIMSAIALAAIFCWFQVVRQIVPREWLAPVAVPTVALGLVYANHQSAPLAAGLYTPAAPVAFLWFFALLWCWLIALQRPSLLRALLAGGLWGACLLTKQDVWLPSTLLGISLPFVAPKRRILLAVGLAVGVGATVTPALWYLVSLTNWETIAKIPSGFGQIEAFGGRSVPTGTQIVADAAMVSLTTVCVALLAPRDAPWFGRSARHWTLAGVGAFITLSIVWLVLSYLAATGIRADPPSHLQSLMVDVPSTKGIVATLVYEYRDALATHALSIWVPVTTGAFVLFSRAPRIREARVQLLLLVALCLLTRARRGLEFTEWHTWLLELPVIAAVLHAARPTFVRDGSRLVRRLAIAGLTLALYVHWREGYGPLTRRGVQPTLETKRGTIRVAAGQADIWRALSRVADSIDPSGRRPVVAFGYTGAFSYLMRRPAATALTHGFRLSILSPDSGLKAIRHARPPSIAIDNPFVEDISVATSLAFHWESQLSRGPYGKYDRPLFNQLVGGCLLAREVAAGQRAFRVYDCTER